MPQKQVKKLQRLLNASIRFVFGIRSRKVSTTPFLKKAHILPINLRIKYKTCLMVFKCINGLAPAYLSELIHKKDSLQSLRIHQDQTLLNVPNLDNQNYKNRRFEIAAPRQWNLLPKSLRESKNIETFKSRLKTFLFDQF